MTPSGRKERADFVICAGILRNNLLLPEQQVIADSANLAISYLESGRNRKRPPTMIGGLFLLCCFIGECAGNYSQLYFT